MRKNLIGLLPILIWQFSAQVSKAQSVLDCFDKVAVQVMKDGKTFRLLQGGYGEDVLVENIRFTFTEIEPGDTVAYQYVPAEDQLYVAAWNPANISKKYTVKFAILWRITSGNPRFGSIKIPAGCRFMGFFKENAVFSNPAKQELYELYFHTTYISETGTVNYDLRGRKKITNFSPNTEYYGRFSPWDYSEKEIPNPFGPKLRNARYKRETFVKDSIISYPLAQLKQAYENQAESPVFGKPNLFLENYTDSFYWRSPNLSVSSFKEVGFFIEDKYWSKENLPLIIYSDHQEVASDVQTNIAQFYHHNGIRGFKFRYRHLPGLLLKITFYIAGDFPVFIADSYASSFAEVTDYISLESYFPKNKNVQAIAAAKFPNEKFEMLCAHYKMNQKEQLSSKELFLALKEEYSRLGLSIDSDLETETMVGKKYTFFVEPKNQNLVFVVIGTASSYPLQVRASSYSETYKWNTIELKKWGDMENQVYHVYSAKAGFPKTINKYECSFEVSYEKEPVYVLFLSEPL